MLTDAHSVREEDLAEEICDVRQGPSWSVGVEELHLAFAARLGTLVVDVNGHSFGVVLGHQNSRVLPLLVSIPNLHIPTNGLSRDAFGSAGCHGFI